MRNGGLDPGEQTNFDLLGLWNAIDHARRERAMTWAAVTREISRSATEGHPIAASTIAGLKDRPVAEGDGVLQMLLWLRRTPESFIPDFKNADDPQFHLPTVAAERTLRWDSAALYAALDEQRQARGLTWTQVAQEIGAFTPPMIRNLANGGRVGFPGVMRLVRWLGQPAARFTRLT